MPRLMQLPVAIGEIVAKKYRVDRVIGAGGMGVVVAAFHLELERPVAIKFLNGEAASRADANERFRREARAAANIRSEHVARVLDIEILHERIPYMVLELLDGHDLEQELVQRGLLPATVAVDYVLQAIEAIAEAHANGVVHRDLKPTNLFLARRGDGSQLVKVLDFGISKLMGPGFGPGAALTRSASIFGSPLYMSPEQMRSAKDVDARADIWSLGAILYELIAGRPPFVGDSMPALCVSILNDTPPPLHQFVPYVPPALDDVLSKCLARDVSDRFDSVATLAEALAPFTPGGQLHAERARRTLGYGVGGGGVTTRLTSDAPVVHASRGSTPAAPSFGPLPVANPTQASWGRTAGRAIVSRRTGTVLGALLLVLSGGWWARALLRAPADTAEPTPAAAPRVAPAVTAPTPSAERASVAPDPVPTEEPSTRALPSTTTAPSAAPPRAERRNGKASITKPAPNSTGATREPSGAPLTDFGGRLY